MGLILTGTWPTPQNAKIPYLKFREQTYISPVLKRPDQLRFLENCPPTPPPSQYIFVMNRVIPISSRKISAHLIATCEEKPLIPRVPFMVLENKVNAVMMTKIENFLCEFTVLHWPGLVLMKDLLTCIKVI